MEGIKYVNLIEISPVVIEIRGAENGELAVPVNNTLVSHTAFLAANTRPCVLILVGKSQTICQICPTFPPPTKLSRYTVALMLRKHEAKPSALLAYLGHLPHALFCMKHSWQCFNIHMVSYNTNTIYKYSKIYNPPSRMTWQG